jgi:Arc/MetJ-type ribon-helix-helix transcriptional regulator
MKTTIQISDSFRKELKTISSVRDISYEEALEDMANIFKKIIPFESEKEFASWFEKNLEKFGFRKIIEKRKKSSPDYKLENLNGEIKEVELELIGTDFIKHKHDPNSTDLIVCLFSMVNEIEGIPVLSVIEMPEDKSQIIEVFDPNLTSISIPKQLADKIKEKIKKMPFNSVSSYITFIMRLVLLEKENNSEAFTKQDEEKLKFNLKKLGYLD